MTPQMYRSGVKAMFAAPFSCIPVITSVSVRMATLHQQLLPKTCVQELVAQALKAVGLSGVEPLFPGELSGGMKKRVALARAIIRDSENDHAEQVNLTPCTDVLCI